MMNECSRNNTNESVWCCTASIDTVPSNYSGSNNDVFVQLHLVAGYNNNNDDLTDRDPPLLPAPPPKHLDLTKAPDWMEYIEWTEHGQYIATDDATTTTKTITDDSTSSTTATVSAADYAAVYDTMRGDFLLHTLNNTAISAEHRNEHKQHRWYIWGKDFHLQRLERSFQSLLEQEEQHLEPTTIKQGVPHLDHAQIESERVLQSLLNEAENVLTESATRRQDIDLPNDNHHKYVYMVRLTLLWSSRGATTTSAITATNDPINRIVTVRGHACCTLCPINVMGSAISPIQCCIAGEIVHDNNTNNRNDNNSVEAKSTTSIINMKTSMALPSRYENHPQIKVAAWIRIRKALEEPERYKPPGVSEVLLVRPCSSIDNATTSSDYELLEGLSSNVFVVYKDGTIHTAMDGVLHGYVRQLVLECCTTIGIPIFTNDPLHPQIHLQDVSEWKEAFITSSSRLLYPISKIRIQHRYNCDNATTTAGEVVVFRDFWVDPVLANPPNTNDADTIPIWLKIYDEMLRQAGYVDSSGG